MKTTKLIFEKETLPAHWASALINDDWTGLEDQESSDLAAWIKETPYYGPCAGVSDDTVIERFNGLLTDCLEYTFKVNVTRTGGDKDQLEYLIYPHRVADEPMPHHKAGLSWTASGYGKKIPTTKVIYLRGRRYRVYVTQYSNAGTAYIVYQGREVIIN